MIVLEETIRWLVFNVVLALLPLIVNFFILTIIKNQQKPDSVWREILKEGELFIFSSTISASSIGTLVFRGFSTNTANSSVTGPSALILTIIISSLIIVLLLSTASFGISTFAKFVRQNTSSDVIFDDKRLSNASLAIAILASLLSYSAFVSFLV